MLNIWALSARFLTCKKQKADQPAHYHHSAVCFLESVIGRLWTCKIALLELDSVAKQVGLSLI